MEREEKERLLGEKLQSDAVRQEQANPTFQPPAKGAHAAAGLKRHQPSTGLACRCAAVRRAGGVSNWPNAMQCKALPMTGL